MNTTAAFSAVLSRDWLFKNGQHFQQHPVKLYGILTGYLYILLSIYLYIFGFTVHLLALGRFFSFLILYRDGRTSWTSDQSVAKPLPTDRTTQTQNKRTQTSMPRVGLGPMTPVFERAKCLHALDRAAGHCGQQQIVLDQIKLTLCN
jgi:hypothetical protein